eukprot:g9438.t1
MDELQGCPAMVNKEPLITDGIRPTEEPGLEQLLEGAVDRPPEPPPWGLIGGLLSKPLGPSQGPHRGPPSELNCSRLGVFREAIEPLFHSSKATVVAHDTFIEPQKDLMVNGLGIESKTYGRVEPRALGLRKLHEEDQVLPLALRQKAENAVPEAANAAWVDEVVKEAEIQRERPQLKDTVVLPGTTYTGEGIPCYPEELDMPYMESHALAVQEPNLPRSRSSDRSKSVDDFSSSHHQSVMSGLPSLNTARSARGSTNRSASKLTALSDTSGVWTSRTGVTVTERALSSTGDDEALSQDMLPELPPSGENADIPEIGHVEGSVSGLVLCPVSIISPQSPHFAAAFSIALVAALTVNATQQSLRLLGLSLAGISAFFIILRLLLTYVLGSPGMVTAAVVSVISVLWAAQRSQHARARSEQEALLMQHRAFAAEVERAWERSHSNDLERRKAPHREVPSSHAPAPGVRAVGETAEGSKKRKKKKRAESEERSTDLHCGSQRFQYCKC